MVNFVLVYKPYTISRESEHRWTMYKNMCVFERVLAAKTTNSDAKTTTAHTYNNRAIITTILTHFSYSAITTTIIVTIFTYLIVRNMLRS